MASAAWASPLRWEYGFSGTNTRAWFEALPLKLNPAIRKNSFDFRDVLKNTLNLLVDVLRVLERGPGRRLHRNDEVALVFAGHESGKI